METNVKIRHTITEQVWDARYCDKCNKLVHMNSVVGTRLTKPITFTKYYVVRNINDDHVPMHFCEECMGSLVSEFLKRADGHYDVEIEIGGIYEDELRLAKLLKRDKISDG